MAPGTGRLVARRSEERCQSCQRACTGGVPDGGGHNRDLVETGVGIGVQQAADLVE